MEEKRTLWIITASGLFLLVVVGAAIILSKSAKGTNAQQAAFNPTDGWTTPTTYSVQTVPPAETDPLAQAPVSDTEADSAAPASPFDQQIQTNNLTVYSDNTTVFGTGSTTTIDLNALKSGSPAVTANNQATANQIASTQAAKQETYTYNYEEPKPAAPAKASTPAKTTAKASAKVPDRFWVQVASYSTKKNADDARATLESNKIPSEVFTYTDAKGKVFYRVRIGSYTTSSEAEYWKTQVAKIDQFANAQSYVVNSSAKAVK